MANKEKYCLDVGVKGSVLVIVLENHISQFKMQMTTAHPAYALIMGADQMNAKSYALDLAKKHHNLLLIGKPQNGLVDLALQLMTYGVEVDVFETDPNDQQNLALLADWIQSSYFISQFINLAEIDWMEEVFSTPAPMLVNREIS